MNKIDKNQNLHKITLLTLFAMFNNILVLQAEDEPTEEAEAKTEDVKEEADIKTALSKNNSPKKGVTPKEALKNLLRSERKLFINGRDSNIDIVVTDKDNKQHYYKIPAGTTKKVEHVPLHIKKIICSDKYQEKDIVITQTTLNTYSVFIFNFDLKPEQFHFIDIKQKTDALNRVKRALDTAKAMVHRDQKLIETLIKKYEDTQEQTIYLQ